MTKIDDLHLWRLFCEVVRSGGVNAACEKLQCEPSTVSRAVKALETELGLPLFEREGRTLRLTELGKRAHQQAEALLTRHDEMIEDLKGDKDALSGIVRLAAHAGIGPLEIAPALVEFLKMYPDMQLELHDLSGRVPAVFQNETGPRIDMAVSYGPATPIPGLVSRYVGEMPFVAVASPLYTQKHGIPKHPAELVEHVGILTQAPSRQPTETLEKDGETVLLHWKSSMMFKNLNSVRSAVILGGGIVPDMPLYHCADALKSGQLVPVLPGWHRKAMSCFVYTTEAAFEKRRVRVLFEWLAEHERRTQAKLREANPAFYV